MRINDVLVEFASPGGGNGGNYLKALASAWYNGTFNTGDLHKGIKSQEDVERMLERGIHCGDGKIRKYSIGYNSNFDGVEIQSDDHYEYSDYDDAGRDIDSRTGQPWGPYDVVEFGGDELDESKLAEYGDTARGQKMLTKVQKRAVDRVVSKKADTDPKYAKKNQDTANRAWDRMTDKDVAEVSLKEFAPAGSNDGNDGFSEETLKKLAAQWWQGDEDPRVERTLMAAGWEIGQDEGYDNGGVFVVQSGDINGNSYISWPAEELEQGVAEGEVTRTPTGLTHRATDKYGAGDEPFNPRDPGKYARDLSTVNKQQVKDLDASMGITWKNRGTKGVEVDEVKTKKPEQPEADYGDDYQAMVSRVKKLAGLGPLKTVYDPAKRVYKNVPTAVQPKK